MDGIHIEKQEHDAVSVVSMAKMLAKIHNTGMVSSLDIQDKFKPWNTEKSKEEISRIVDVIESLASPTQIDLNIKRNLVTKMRMLNEVVFTFESFGLPSSCLIHGDYLDHNLFFNNKKDVSFVFDFEKVQYAPKVYELIRSVIYSFFNKNVEERDIFLAKLYVDSYRKETGMSLEEFERGCRMYYIKYLHSQWVESEYYIKGNQRVSPFLEDSLIRFDLFSKLDGNLQKIFNS